MFLLVFSGLTVSLASCGQSEARKPTFAIPGRVLDGSKPLANATVAFLALDGSDAATPSPRGRTDETGTFRLTTYDADDGAPAVQYRVTVEQWATPNPELGPVNRVPAKYANPAGSGFTADLSAGLSEPKPFIIKRLSPIPLLHDRRPTHDESFPPRFHPDRVAGDRHHHHPHRPTAARLQCGNNLKQLGLGLHNHHDAQNGLPSNIRPAAPNGQVIDGAPDTGWTNIVANVD